MTDEITEPVAKKRIAKAQSGYTTVPGGTIFYGHLDVANNSGRPRLPGYVDSYGALPRNADGSLRIDNYHSLINVCRWFYRNNPIAGTVIERMADMSMTTLKNRRKSKTNADIVDDTTMAFYNAVAKRLKPFLKIVALEYLVHGLVVPDHIMGKIRGNKIAEQLGRKQYWIPESIWVRNPSNLILKKRPIGMERQVYLKIPKEDIEFITNDGKRSDGTDDPEGYRYLVENFPEYVQAIKNGKTTFLLENVHPILRKVNSYDEYPTPFLTKALGALQHKEYLKVMDRSIASRAIEAVRHIKIGDKDFPADDDDITNMRNEVENRSSLGEIIYNLFTNHTITIEWVFPPLDALLNENKYLEPNADIFLGLGFPRILTVGETQRSNSSDSKIASLGPKSTLDDLRESILDWLENLYAELAEKNGFTRYPEPYFSPIATSDYTALVQFAIDALNAGAISKDTVAQLYNTDYETEAAQIQNEAEMGVLSPSEREKKRDREFQMEIRTKDQANREKEEQQRTKEQVE